MTTTRSELVNGRSMEVSKPSKLTITVLQGLDFPIAPSRTFLRTEREFYLLFIVDGQKQRTKTVAKKNGVVEWNETLSFITQKSSILHAEVYAFCRSRKDIYIGGWEESIANIHTPQSSMACLLNISTSVSSVRMPASATRSSSRPSHSVGHEHQSAARITLNIVDPGPAQRDWVDAVSGARLAISQMRTVAGAMDVIASSVVPATSTLDSAYNLQETWKILLDKVQAFIRIVDEVAEIHPYAKMAWSILTMASKVIVAQNTRDTNIRRLFDTLDDVYTLMNTAKELLKFESYRLVLARMAQQVIECGYFIRSYAETRNYWTRMGMNVVSNTDDRITDYQNKFTQLIATFNNHLTVLTEIKVFHVLHDVRRVAREVDLNEMIYAKGARFNGDKQCLNGTREEVLEEIEQWINSTQDVPPVYMLCGSAGTGKSAIANTVARRFNALKRLGSSFCFNRHLQKERGPEHLFPTIARDLSGLHSGISQALWEIIRYDKSLRTTHDIEEQFENFILKPLCSINISGPILIVIDALDESGYPRARRAMLSILARRVSELPANFRLLLTSRPEDDIECFFKDNSLILMKRMDSIAASVTERDILVYVRAQLSNNQGRLSEGIEDVHCRILAQKSESLFQWASVACGIIRGDTGKAGYTIDERFELIVASSTASHRRQTPLLDDLYSAALAQILNKDDADALSRFKSVMGQILAAYEPLSIDTLNGLRQGIDSSSHVGVITSILRYMGSLLSGVSSVDHSLPIRPLHTTFRDFLTDPSRSGDFYIDLSLSHTDLALASLRVMNKKLKVNICRLETSYQRNADVLDLEDRITEYIPPYLSYSCRFWADHLRDSPFQPQLLHEVKDFLYDRLLCWFEVLSLISAISIAWQKLSYLVEWSSKVHEQSEDIILFASEAQNIPRCFGNSISQSAAHVYLSVIPFIPRMSFLHYHFSSRFPRVASVFSGYFDDWPTTQNILRGHTAPIRAVSFSPNSRLVVSGSDDSTIRIWDAETGVLALAPLKGHCGAVTSVKFSPDSTRVVSGSKDSMIRVWCVQTGAEICAPLQDHTGGVTTISYSTHGQMLVSGSEDATVRIWAEKKGTWGGVPLEGHGGPVTAVAFSPENSFVVSSSYDRTIRVWDVKSCAAIMTSGPMDVYGSFMTFIALSPDCKRVALGLDNSKIGVWDTGRDVTMRSSFVGHADTVTAVSFSLDGTRIVSGSEDWKIRFWVDKPIGDRGQSVTVPGIPFRGHTAAITSVQFSPCGDRVVSGSCDWTVRLWDARSCVEMLSPPHAKPVIKCVAFSPDGTLIVSATDRYEITIRNSKTGATVAYAYLYNRLQNRDRISSVTFSQDSKLVAFTQSTLIYILDAKDCTPVSKPLVGHTSLVTSAKFLPDGNIISGSNDRMIRVWNINSGETISVLQAHTGSILSISLSSDGSRMVSGSEDKTIRVWNVQSRRSICTLEGHTDKILTVVISSDGQHVASMSEDMTVRIWDIDSAKERTIFPLEGVEHVFGFSPDVKFIAVSSERGCSIHVWDMDTRLEVCSPLEGHTRSISCIAFPQNGRHIVSCSYDRTIRIWDTAGTVKPSDPLTATGHTLSDHPEEVQSSREFSLAGAFSPNPEHALPGVHFAELAIQRPGHPFFPQFVHLKMSDDGWIVGPQSQLILWVPDEHRRKLWWPNTTTMIFESEPGNRHTILDLSRFACGFDWDRCCEPVTA